MNKWRALGLILLLVGSALEAFCYYMAARGS